VRRRDAHDFGAGFGAGAGVGDGGDVEASGIDVDDAGASAEVGWETSGPVLGSAGIDVDGSGSGSVNGSFGSMTEVEGSDAIIEGLSSARSGVFTREKEVFVETGEPGTGVSGAVDGVVVDSVPLAWSVSIGTDVLVSGSDTSDGKETGGSGVGEGGGVGILRANLITSGGGRA